MSSLVLYSTDNCTLCDKALELLLSMPEVSGHSLTVVDVAVDPELVQRYGERLPVLCYDGAEIESPLERDRLVSWLADLE